MPQFIYCYDEDLKKKLINNGFKCLKSQVVDSSEVWIFVCDKGKFSRLDFDMSKLSLSNRLTF